MAQKPARRNPWPSRLHFLIRAAGLTGLLALGAGLVMALLADPLASWATAWSSLRQTVLDAGQGHFRSDLLGIAGILVAAGGLFAALWLLIDTLSVLRFGAARRSAFGFNAILQIALATALLVGVNYYASDPERTWRF